MKNRTKKNLIRLINLLLIVSCGSNIAVSYDEDDLQRLFSTKKCIECDLTKANLEFMNLKGALLTKSNLSQAILSHAYLAEADLIFEEEVDRIIHQNILNYKKRPDILHIPQPGASGSAYGYFQW